jgi:hypothetical protein
MTQLRVSETAWENIIMITPSLTLRVAGKDWNFHFIITRRINGDDSGYFKHKNKWHMAKKRDGEPMRITHINRVRVKRLWRQTEDGDLSGSIRVTTFTNTEYIEMECYDV